jgi:nucleoside phosphorylase
MTGRKPWLRADPRRLAEYVPTGAERLLGFSGNRLDLQVQGGVRTLAAAIYEALLQAAIQYDLEQYIPSEDHQYIRSPEEILGTAPQRGTCLDLSVLFAGLCLDSRLIPIMVVLEDHALVALSTTHLLDEWSAPSRAGGAAFLDPILADQADWLVGQVDSGNLIAVECTGFARSESLSRDLNGHPETVGRVDGVMTFDRAVAAGAEQLRRRTLRFAIDLAVARFKWNYESDSPVQQFGFAQNHSEDASFNPERGIARSLRRTPAFAFQPGRLYLPFPNGSIFGDDVCIHDGKYFAASYSGLGAASKAVAWHRVLHPSDQLHDKIYELFGSFAYRVGQVHSARLDQLHRPLDDISDFKDKWPLALTDKALVIEPKTTEKVILRSDENRIQKQRIVAEARKFLDIYGVALSEDYSQLLLYMDALKQYRTLRVSLNVASPASLRVICDREIDAIVRLAAFSDDDGKHILKTLSSEYDVQALEKYMAHPSANLARAAVDSMTALQFLYLMSRSKGSDNSFLERLTVRFYEKPPTVRGAVTENEIAYVATERWQPGMMGHLFIHRRTNDPAFFDSTLTRIGNEIDDMMPREVALADAMSELKEVALEDLSKAAADESVHSVDRTTIRDWIRSIPGFAPLKGETNIEAFERLTNLRGEIRKTFALSFERLDRNYERTIVPRVTNPRRAAMEENMGPADVVIITVKNMEREAICRYFKFGSDNRRNRDGDIYWVGHVPVNKERDCRVVVVQCPDQANHNAALATAKAINAWSPQFILLVGIAGRTRLGAALGDVVVGESIYYFERGKVTPQGKLPEPVMFQGSKELLENVRTMADPFADGGFASKRPDDSNTLPQILFGVIASGEKVVADEMFRDELASFHHKLLAIEMEGYGFALANWQSMEKAPYLVIRGICDDATMAEDNIWQPYAADAAAFVATRLVLDFISLRGLRRLP